MDLLTQFNELRLSLYSSYFYFFFIYPMDWQLSKHIQWTDKTLYDVVCFVYICTALILTILYIKYVENDPFLLHKLGFILDEDVKSYYGYAIYTMSLFYLFTCYVTNVLGQLDRSCSCFEHTFMYKQWLPRVPTFVLRTSTEINAEIQYRHGPARPVWGCDMVRGQVSEVGWQGNLAKHLCDYLHCQKIWKTLYTKKSCELLTM